MPMSVRATDDQILKRFRAALDELYGARIERRVVRLAGAHPCRKYACRVLFHLCCGTVGAGNGSGVEWPLCADSGHSRDCDGAPRFDPLADIRTGVLHRNPSDS